MTGTKWNRLWNSKWPIQLLVGLIYISAVVVRIVDHNWLGALEILLWFSLGFVFFQVLNKKG